MPDPTNPQEDEVVVRLTRENERLRNALGRLESAGEGLAVEARLRLQAITVDNPDDPAWNGPQAQALTIWNEARNALRPEKGPTDNTALDPGRGKRRLTEQQQAELKAHNEERIRRRLLPLAEDAPCLWNAEGKIHGFDFDAVLEQKP